MAYIVRDKSPVLFTQLTQYAEPSKHLVDVDSHLHGFQTTTYQKSCSSYIV
ncbi:hypothetical protein DPMN_014686 [Dreissena polymorpha]|uniref:Uncharacterized protein n=1 Tax=Dreissena polymorpha TaxID=45954 RepID=A0A9D4N9N9_DREPO|nr:hypothetical protein DPMN_014686 [Dreissena polymorpha]